MKHLLSAKNVFLLGGLMLTTALPASTLTASASSSPSIWSYRNRDLRNLPSANVRGRITNEPSNGYFELRGDNNSRYRVIERSRNNHESDDLDRGDRVRVVGKRDGNILIATDLVKLDDDDDNNSDNNWQDGNSRTLYGTVYADNNGRRFGLRLRNGTRLNVQARESEPLRLSTGDYVEVKGRWNNRNQVFRADSVRIMRNDDGGSASFEGIVRDRKSDQRFSILTDNGRELEVYSRSELDDDIDRGDRVRVVGSISRQGSVNATSVRLLRNGTSGGTSNNWRVGERVSFRGEIVSVSQQIGGAYFYSIRADNGRRHAVRYTGGRHDVGDRVSVQGIKRERYIEASDID